jgi:formate/nitrite transporter FocA (FNT family)
MPTRDREGQHQGADENGGGMPKERREAIGEQQRPNALIIHETIRLEGEEELRRRVSSLLLSGFAAGLSMGFSLVCQGLLQSHLPEAPWRHLITSLGYTIGFLIVVLGRQQLFTENTLTPILPLLHNRDLATLWRVARLWVLVLVANMAATWVISYALLKTEVFEPDTRAAFLEISHHAIASPFLTTFLKAIFAGWLIALMVWLLPAAEAARVFVVLIITYVVSLGEFAHIIAGSVDAAYLVYAGEASIADYVTRFFLPTILGNVLGGVALVGVLNYGQVAPQIRS